MTRACCISRLAVAVSSGGCAALFRVVLSTPAIGNGPRYRLLTAGDGRSIIAVGRDAMRTRFAIRYVRAAIGHLRALPARDHGGIRDAIKDSLGHIPDTERRNRKPLEQPCVFGLAWQLRAARETGTAASMKSTGSRGSSGYWPWARR